ncbi:MAG: hypothetical protein HY513_04800 [Candidatus Aenigmarchaeota archaeon]|nr:hypothetical protein [Candidatus Aenigmarchaeota archaeon]
MTKTNVAIRDVDEETFRKFRSLAVEENRKLGDEITLAMKHWISEDKSKKVKNILVMKPIKVGAGKVRWSEEIDETLYGWKK